MTSRADADDASDAALVGRALAGAQPAYREIVRRYQAPVLNLVERVVRNRSEAEDLTQEVFVKAFRALDRYDPARKLSSWLFTIAHRHAIDHLRRRRPRDLAVGIEEGTLADPLPSPAAAAERAALADALAAGLDAIRLEYREAVVLRYQEDLSTAEIAAVMEVPEGTVKTYLHRARKALAVEMARRGWSGAGGGGRRPGDGPA